MAMAASTDEEIARLLQHEENERSVRRHEQRLRHTAPGLGPPQGNGYPQQQQPGLPASYTSPGVYGAPGSGYSTPYTTPNVYAGSPAGYGGTPPTYSPDGAYPPEQTGYPPQYGAAPQAGYPAQVPAAGGAGLSADEQLAMTLQRMELQNASQRGPRRAQPQQSQQQPPPPPPLRTREMTHRRLGHGSDYVEPAKTKGCGGGCAVM
ncbi:hypothetical protein DIPPA_05223 [Diplonema papillatum]|nr:hypothetical protein DIPPA_05223 [Diplonema papillatum]